MATALSLDHCGCLTQDLDAGAARWERLGFCLSARSRQRGAVPDHAGMQPWATANHCVMLQRGYLELIGVVDRGAHNPWASFLARNEGLHIVALRCDDADAAYAALSVAAPFLRPPVQRERPLEVAGELRMLRFRNVFSDDAQCPEARYIVIEHQTPELLWQPRYLDHGNGALSLDEAVFVADVPAPILQRLLAFGRGAAADTLELKRGTLRVMTTSAFADEYGYQPSRLPGLHAVTIGVRDAERAAQLLKSQGVRVRLRDGYCQVPPAETGGFALRLVTAKAAHEH